MNTSHNDGLAYEIFVSQLQQALLDSEEYIKQKNIKVEVNKILLDRNGIGRQFDIYWEYELGGVDYRTVIECKDYASPISVEKIDALIGKTADIPEINKKIFATKTGYQSGAKTKALQHHIDLLIVREQNDSDWMSKDGTPLIKTIDITMNLVLPAQITSISSQIDKDWFDTQAEHTLEELSHLSYDNINTFINDLQTGQRLNLSDFLQRQLDNNIGENLKKEFEFNNAYLETQGISFKVKKIEFTYDHFEPIVEKIIIDGSKELKGVIQYLNKETKKIVFNDGRIKDR